MTAKSERLDLLLPGTWSVIDLSSKEVFNSSCAKLVDELVGLHDSLAVARRNLRTNLQDKFAKLIDIGGQSVFFSKELKKGLSWQVTVAVFRPTTLAVPEAIADSLALNAASYASALIDNSENWGEVRELVLPDAHVIVRSRIEDNSANDSTDLTYEKILQLADENNLNIALEDLRNAVNLDNENNNSISTLTVEYWIVRPGINRPTLLIATTNQVDLFENFELLFDAVVESSLDVKTPEKILGSKYSKRSS